MAEKHNQPKEAPQGESGNQPGKTAWPEVVGLTTEVAEKKIKEEVATGTQVHVVPSDSFVTMDFRTDRVRIFIDSSGKVVRPPKIG
ncbi:subtilisin inhibitor CLSI-I-like [Salvia miltiorrhiza]|uniref:subtilisin inhibitor CLSI-I-like n=1 Tax=Salvia miltiorrhiza TaxID=226208 RepID=UPI0025ABC028|nr:subtilisin inhibitor CLSI-I-like [Salvia miltiorrhiza]